ncbi:MAG: V-type ATP synthase subunit A [Clostridia bacterium]|nr:V-type ATP synthase subunit A [Clostridia bacterium]
MTERAVIKAINGPVVTSSAAPFFVSETVRVGREGLLGEVIAVTESGATVQVYEPTGGLTLGEEIIGEGTPVSLTLGPGILDNIFDGIGRPLRDLEKKEGKFIGRGCSVPSLDETAKRPFTITVKPGDGLKGGAVFATVPETPSLIHKCMVPPGITGTVESTVPDGEYTVADVLVTLRTESGEKIELKAAQKWPIRKRRPVGKYLSPSEPLVTGQRVIDSLFPVAKGGTAAIPGGFGTGKTMTQHQLAKWCDADVIIYVGCGERGNEMTQVLTEFSELTDPRTGRPMTERTCLIANTSNMPVAAREASVYTGITLAEYYRDMGYDVAVMADSTSRWAEALREISGRLEEMPAEEGYPAYLPSRLAEFYERAGRVETLSGDVGSVTLIGAVSPQGSDFSEPVTQNTKRFVRCFWALDKSLAWARHYPAINWIDSYSEYGRELEDWFAANVGERFGSYATRIASLLAREKSLEEIVKLIGDDVLPDDQKLILLTAGVIRNGFLQQNAFHPVDTFVPLEKQMKMMEIILYLYDAASRLVADAVPVSHVSATGIFEDVSRMKYEIPNDDFSACDAIKKRIDAAIAKAER